MESGDEVLAVAAAHQLGLVTSSQWPMVAAYLVVAGNEGEHVTRLAGLTATTSGWQIDHLIPEVMEEIGAPTLTAEEAAVVVARLFALVGDGDDHSVVRALAALAPTMDYPGGRIGQAYEASEWLDCDCHGPAAADRLQEEIAAMPRLRLPTALARTLTTP